MKKIIFSITILFITTISCNKDEPEIPPCNGGVYKGDITFTTQQEIIDFGEKCYTKITGTLKVSEATDTADSITSLEPLYNLAEIDGGLNIYIAPSLTSFKGLRNLSKVGGNIKNIGPGGFVNDSGITNFMGLDNLNEIGGGIVCTMIVF